MGKRLIPTLAAAVLLVASCAVPKDVAYFQEADYLEVNTPDKLDTKIKLKPGDKLCIIVTCSDQRLTNLLNLPYITQRLGQTTNVSYNYSQGVSGYTLDAEGNIDFPAVGLINVAGLTREQCAEKIKAIIEASQLAKDPVVTVDYMNLSVSVLGEVTKPGRYFFDKDNFTIVDAISMAGDLTINGLRTNVQVIREENGVQKTYLVDLTSAQNMITSPVFNLQQNDIVYVEPNDVRKRQSTVNGNNVLSTSFWISLASLASTLTLTVLSVLGRR